MLNLYWLILLAPFMPGAPVEALDQLAREKADRARALLQLLIDRKYADFVAESDARLKTEFDVNAIALIWTTTTFRVGEYRSLNAGKLHRSSLGWAFYFSCRFQQGRAVIMITLDDADQLIGFRVLPPYIDVPYHPPAYVDASAFHEEKVDIPTHSLPLRGALTLPNSRAPHASVVLVHSWGPHDEDETAGQAKPFRDLAWGLASRGLTVLRYVKRTQQYPLQLHPEDLTLANETVDDVLAAVAMLRGRSEIDGHRVFVVGMSLGGFAAPFIAQRDAKLGGIVVMAGNARSILDVIGDQVDYLAKSAGPPHDDAAHIRKVKAVLAATRAGNLAGAGTVLDLPVSYLYELHQLDPVGTASRLQMPILILQGGRDWRVTSADFALWKDGLKDHTHASFKYYENLGHAFMHVERDPLRDELATENHIAPEVVVDIANWIHGTKQ